MSTAIFNNYTTTTIPIPNPVIAASATPNSSSNNNNSSSNNNNNAALTNKETTQEDSSPRSTVTRAALTNIPESLLMPSMIGFHDSSIGATGLTTEGSGPGSGATTTSALTPSSSTHYGRGSGSGSGNFSHNSTVDTSCTGTANTISTNNTLTSLNHNAVPNNNNIHGGTNTNNGNGNGNSIPDGYSVHIKASSSNNNNNNNNSNHMVKQSSNIMSSSMNMNMNMNMNMSSSSSASSPVPPAAPASTTSSSSSSFNPSLPNLTSSSESLSTFNIFEGLNNFPLIGSGANSVSTSSFANALFNTNPLPTPPTTTLDHTNSIGGTTNIVTDETVAQIVSNTSVPEFLYQLTKMLTDDHRDIIEWSSGKIEVHNPTKLEKEVLNQYFRHSKYASFQRQLNYFGFRKLAGKGKMAPCSYVNENATSDLRSLLRMKRKTSATTKDGKSNTTDGDSSTNQGTKGSHGRSNKKSSSNKRARTSHRQLQHLPRHPHQDSVSSSTSFKIAKGSGVKHQLNGYLAGNSNTSLNNISNNSNSAATTTALNYNANNSILPSTGTSSSQITPINNPLVPDPMTSLDPLSIAKAAVGKGVTHQYSSSLPSTQHRHHGNVNASTNNRTGTGTSINNGIGIGQGIISGMPTDSCNKLTFLEPSQLGMGLESCLSELQTNFQNSLNEANANNNSNTNNINSSNTNITNGNNNLNMNNNGAGNAGMNNNNINGQYTNTQATMQRESSLVDLAIIPSLASTLNQSAGNNSISLDTSLTSNSKSLENDYGMTFIDFPIGGLPQTEG